MSNTPQVTQVRLVSQYPGDNQLSTIMTTWLDDDPRIKRGAIISLKGDIRWWIIAEVYSTLDKHTIDHHGWDNNNYDKHDGTSMKDRTK